ncbi:MAG: hypothetical protein B7Y40_06875 [Gammaproteobacteria bacterium 28-57-27]|nr:MAG: hypothetical protein B7Y40_06875 [Gammaproteobacteria bacterium 28-57-27]
MGFPWSKLAENALAVGWGRKKSGLRAERAARRWGEPMLLLEEGFLRSYGLGASGARALSLVTDDVGIYYDATRPSRLENLLNAGHFTPELITEAARVLRLIRQAGLSKYNIGRQIIPAKELSSSASSASVPKRILVVDQTAGDASIRYGLANTAAFSTMLEAAIDENPDAEVWVKTHPDVLAGKKKGCLDAAHHRSGIHWISENWHPHALLEHFERVYVATSQMGFDALLLDKPVTCFGVPFYAGWGLTDDRQACSRRTAKRTLLELVAAAYLQYPRYIQPETAKPGTFFDVAEFVARQKRMVGFWE